MLEFLGWSAEALIGRHVREVIGEATYAGYLPVVERVWARRDRAAAKAG